MLTRASATVEFRTVLIESDEPEVALATDQFRSTYLCSLVSVLPEGRRYIAVRVTDRRMQDLREGLLSIRAALLDPEELPRFSGVLPPQTETAEVLQLEAVAEFPEDWLPGPSFLLSNFTEPVADDDVVRDALAANRAVLVFRLDPPEARGTVSQIDADRLADGLREIQSLVRYATKRAIRTRPKGRRKLFGEDAEVLRVFALSPGSVNVHCESKYPADLFGGSIVGEAMRQVDDLMSLLSLPPDEVLPALEKHRGHVVGAYASLLKFVADQNTPLSYRWSEPGLASTRGRSVSPVAAKAMCAVLERKETLASDYLTFTGHFTSVNTDKAPFSWSARDVDEDKRRRGHVHEQFEHALEGATIRSLLYRFTCETRLERLASGKQTVQLYLQNAEPVDAANA